MINNDCIHEKVYENCLLLSYPPQNRWICRICKETGIETIGVPITHEYEKLIKEKEEQIL